MKSMRIPSAESLMHEMSIPIPPLRIGRASKAMDHAGEFFGSIPLHDPQDAASILQNSHRAIAQGVPCKLVNNMHIANSTKPNPLFCP